MDADLTRQHRPRGHSMDRSAPSPVFDVGSLDNPNAHYLAEEQLLPSYNAIEVHHDVPMPQPTRAELERRMAEERFARQQQEIAEHNDNVRRLQAQQRAAAEQEQQRAAAHQGDHDLQEGVQQQQHLLLLDEDDYQRQ